MLFKMLDPKFEFFCLISFFIGHEKGVVIVEEYNKISLYLMFIKCHYYLHMVTRFKIHCLNPNENCALNIFEQIVNTNELMKKLVGRELLISKNTKGISKILNVLFNGGRSEHKSIFFIILSIVRSQIEVKRTFSLIGILTIFFLIYK